MWRTDVMNTSPGNNNGRDNQKPNDNKSDERFSFSVAIGVIPIRRTARVFKSKENQKGTEQVRTGFNSICYQCKGMSEIAGNEFYSYQHHVAEHAEVGRANRFLLGRDHLFKCKSN